MYTFLAYGVLLYIGAVALYRLFFHPLRQYPGPLLAAVTQGYQSYFNVVKVGGLVYQLDKLHKIYGPVVRIGPNTLHFNYREAYHDIYTYGSTLVKDREFYHGMVPYAAESSVGFVDPSLAKTRRGNLAPMFSRRAVVAMEHSVQQKVDKLLTILSEHHTSPESSVDMGAAYRSFTMDVITSYCFAESVNTLDAPGFDHPFNQNVADSFRVFWDLQHFFSLIPLFIVNHLPRKLAIFLPLFGGYLDLKSAFENQVDDILRDPSKLTSVDHDTIYRHLLDEGPLPREALIQEAFVLMAAGGDTSGTASQVGTFYALKNPEIHRRLLEELCDAWPNMDQPMSYVALEKLPYFNAFVKETLRFAIGIIHPLPRVVGPATPSIGGLKLPIGTTVSMSSIFLHMNPDVFPDPHDFNPDRWLADDTSTMMLDLAPFCKGPRICLAWCELYLVLGNVFRKLDLKMHATEDMYVPHLCVIRSSI
ncbi:cytochrome P450 [Rhodocollybia butyracea]|uniref:Cytochrome P450 n=1 Tax=Rhodocollybia butyracea TaxID=206335 RepID=A0A9P5PI53_9AGAR|nr:cytochrome P450 [Rhodocollybia butyracea]